MTKDTNHYCLSQSYWSREHLISEFGNEVVANRRILAKLLLEPFGVSLKMLDNFVIHCHKYGSHLKHQLSKMHSTAALVWSSHKEDTICRELDQSVFLQGTLPSSIRMN